MFLATVKISSTREFRIEFDSKLRGAKNNNKNGEISCFSNGLMNGSWTDALSTLDSEIDGYAEIRQALIKAGQKAYDQILNNVNTVNQWKNPGLILLGGGSLNQGLREALLPHPMINWKDELLQIVRVSVPNDLRKTDGSAVDPKDAIFTSVAYGLAQIGPAVPVAARPSEIQPVVRHACRALPDHASIYGD